MRRRATNDDDMAPGQDSFLDVVANLVGILIILVMVVGVCTKEAYLDAAPQENPPPGPTEADVARAQKAADAVQNDIHEIAAKIKRHELEVAYRQRERDKILTLITLADQTLEQEKSSLSDHERRQLELHAQAEQLKRQLAEIEQARNVAENNTAATSIIEHLPTPMAKTVFGKELHFRLLRGKLTHLPWDEVVERLKEEASNQLWKLENANSITETAGPVGGFRIRYTLKKVESSTATKMGIVVQRRIELDHFQLVPVSEDLGEPVERALEPNSHFRSLLATVRPNDTTVTIWVYPDSFDQFRQIKSEIYKLGFLTAARPLPEGRLIGGSPQGTRSASQ